MMKTSMTVLSRGDRETVHQAALSILEKTGVRVESPAVLQLLQRAGAKVDSDKQLAHLGESIIKDALRSAPKKVSICSRRGVDHDIPGEGVQLISTDGQPPAIFDVETGVKRPSKLKDLIDLCIMADALPEVDFVWPPVVATDMPADRSSFYEFLAAITHCSKHIQHGAATAEEARFQIEIASAILDGEEELRKRPIFSDVCTPISPLRYDQGEAEALVTLAKAGVPVVHLSMAIAGSVTPVSLAGSIAIIAAENLCGITMSQLASQGAPCIYSSFSGVTDLRSGVFLCGTPEGVLMDVAAIEMAKHYGLPSCAGGPSNSSRFTMFESGFQTGMTSMASILAGSDLMVGLGGMDRASMVSKEKLVMDCEAWRWLERLRRGVEIDNDKIGFDAIQRQGPGGTFLSDPHTLRHMRKELLIPQVTGHHDPCLAGASTDDMIEHAKRKVREILATHTPPFLDKDVAARVGGVATKYGIVNGDGSQIFNHV